MNPSESARARQRQAARPDQSVALRASAGSGKTRVLVERFLRLCIESTAARTHPRAILAVTFTRKAAVEILERLLENARDLAMADAAELDRRLRDLFGDRENPAPDATECARAANLYEQILSDAGGLNVGTIHSFCQLVLGRFAAEAGLDPGFGVVEDPGELRDEAFERLVGEIAQDAEMAAAAGKLGADPDSVRRAVQACLDENMRLERWLNVGQAADDGAALLRQRPPRTEALPRLVEDLQLHLFPQQAHGREVKAADLAHRLADALEAFAAAAPAAVDAAFGDGLPDVPRRTLGEMVAGAMEISAAARLGGSDQAAASTLALALASTRKLFVTSDGKLRAFTRGGGARYKGPFNILLAELSRPVMAALGDGERLDLLESNVAVLRLGLRWMDLVDDLKRRDHVVDFQDLEDLASRLLSDTERALGLQYRLDHALQHLLLDEFQDTNVNQWDLLLPFVSEFLAGGSDRVRTVFFVGDVKQSIYGFRGADPGLFGLACQVLAGHGQPVFELPTNFRSLQAIVEGVGCVFNAPPLASELESSELQSVKQHWARTDRPGVFAVHAPYADAMGPGAVIAGGGEQAAAAAAARLVRELRANGEEVWDSDDGWRPLQWRDVLVLARTRTDFALYEKAFRDQGIPFVPPGRGMLAASREVQDLLALLRWLVWPDDDVALATVLRSPLFRLGEGEFQTLLSRRGLVDKGTHGRWRTPRGLWQMLREAPEPPLAAAARLLAEWRRHLGFESCHELLRRIARDAHLANRYKAALGEQARFNLERLFDLALGAEVLGTPTVRRLAEVIERAAGKGSEDEAPLPTDGEGRVRFMTVHAAKGLEAPVVLLVDANRAAVSRHARVRLVPEAHSSPLLLHSVAAQRKGIVFPDGVAGPDDPLAAAVKAAEDGDRAEQAHLLYVALTRARDRLHVIGGERRTKEDHESPLRSLQQAAEASGCASIALPGPDDEPQPVEVTTVSPRPTTCATPIAEQTWQPPARRPRYRVVTPSAVAGQEPALVARPVNHPRPTRPPASDTELPPTIHGDLVHRLLQIAVQTGAVPAGHGSAGLEAAGVLAVPALSWVFQPAPDGSRAFCELPVIGERAGPGGAIERVTGIIDRMVLRPGRVDIIDYKTNRGSGDAVHLAELIEHYRPQLAAYRDVMAAAYGDREVHTWLLFTEPHLADNARLHEVI